MSVFLCGETGIINRGCEAIIRATVDLLPVKSGDIWLATMNLKMDQPVIKGLGVNGIEYKKYPSCFHKVIYGGLARIFRGSFINQYYRQRPLFKYVRSGDLCLNIGGDTYCCSTPSLSYALNEHNERKGVPTILWCCSIDDIVIDRQMKRDLLRYKYIFVRESISYENLVKVGIPKHKLVKCCDPAFTLKARKVDLPKGFLPSKTVGINVSELVVNGHNLKAYSCFVELIRYIIEKTDLSVCLIPHVYNVSKNSNDFGIMKRMVNDCPSDRVFLIDREYDCEQLKYIISQCQFFIGSRTHATIAAYSSCVPTIAVGYSVKSKGIATDIFGSWENYVIPAETIKNGDQLIDAFLFLQKNEDNLAKRLEEFLPGYIHSLTDAIDEYISPLVTPNNDEICRKELCTGCSACKSVCSNDCISMISDNEGFSYPQIESCKCVACGKCRDICPVLNKKRDDGKRPVAFAARIVDDDILLKSSSGGVFSALAKRIIDAGGIVFGAALDEKMSVNHISCDNVEDLSRLRGSKYVQSDIGRTYTEVESYLKKGMLVLFSGTPCQVAGLYAVLNHIPETLYTVDLICHGVPSPMAWKNYVTTNESVYHSKIIRADFRKKLHSWRNYHLCFEFEDGHSIAEVITENIYLRDFVYNYYLRPSCHLCSYRTTHRPGDITLGDFWSVNRTKVPLDDDRGASLLLINSEKGHSLVDNVSGCLFLEAIDFNDAVLSIPNYYESPSPAVFRNVFLQKLQKDSFDRVHDKYASKKLFSRTLKFVAKLLD